MLSPTFNILAPAASWVRIDEPLLTAAKVELWIYCPVSTEPMVSGNKWMKLQYHINLIQQQQYCGFVTFGGAFSNHLAASAVAANQAGLCATAYVRTDHIDLDNPTLRFCHERGMILLATDRQTYRLRQQTDYLELLAQRHPNCLIIPEGGSSVLGARGIACLDLSNTPAGRADVIATATASGGTLAGLIMSTSNQTQSTQRLTQIIGLAVVNDRSLPHKISALLSEDAAETVPWRIVATAPEQRYAKCPTEHIEFSCNFTRQHGVAIEPVYTGRALYKLYQMIAAGEFAQGSRMSFFHTGGLQGLAGLYYRRLITQQQYQLLSAAAAG